MKEALKIQNEGNLRDLHKETEFVQSTGTNLFLTLSVIIRNSNYVRGNVSKRRGLSKGIWPL